MISVRLTPWSSKLFVFFVPSLIGGVAFWFFVQQALRGHVAFNDIAVVNVGIFLLLGLMGLAVWLAPLLLVPYLATWRSVRLTAAVTAALPMFFFFPFQPWAWAAGALLVAMIAWGMESIADDMHNRLTVQPMLSLPRGITFVIFSVIAAISLLYFQQLRGSSATTDELSSRLVDQTVTLSERALPLVYQAYQPGMKVDELIGAELPTADSILKDIQFDGLTTKTEQRRALEQRLQDLGIEGTNATIDTKQTEAQIRQQLDAKLKDFRTQTIDQTRLELATRFGITLQSGDTVHDALRRIIGKQFDTYVRRFVTFVPVLLALALFFVLRFFTSLLQAAVVWFGWVWLKVIRAFKLIQVTHQNVPAERLEWRT